MKRLVLLPMLLLLALPLLVSADGPTAESNAIAIDFIWTLVAAFLVFFMQAGFAMLEVGLTRAKSACNIIMKNLIDFSIGALMFWAIGFGVMFGAGNMLFGAEGFFFSTVGSDAWQYVFWMFHVMFAATAATIVSGAVAERIKFSGYLFYTIFITALVYPIVGHWIWGGGWLASLGIPLIDFAGSTVVHSVGGWSALAGAIILGPRIGKYVGKSIKPINGHNLPLAALGVFILWFGWYGFNPGSTVSGTNAGIAVIAVTTTLAGAAATVATMLTSWIRYKKPDVALTLGGAVAGLVAITAGCANVSPSSAVIIGSIAGILYVFSVSLLDRLKVDDPVGAVSAHGVCGAWGTIAVGLFAESGFGGVSGLFFGGGAGQLVSQMLGVVTVFVFVFGSMILFFKAVDMAFGLRVKREDELKGLDLSEHNAEAYADFAITATND
ncbi:TPA: ammonium transporter [Candidatus Woesearchaeota archaeon]|nr:ammonium transporter [Candidatus Woesearchaeota archaeon]HII69544.1 ammonium transporter [Candidatus Woesearchaeota archaeon]